jgi:hypothetical protein
MHLLTASKTLAETIKKIWPGPVKPNTTKKEVNKIMFLRKNALKATISLHGVTHSFQPNLSKRVFLETREEFRIFYL